MKIFKELIKDLKYLRKLRKENIDIFGLNEQVKQHGRSLTIKGREISDINRKIDQTKMLNCNVHYRGTSWVFVMGRYKNKDYVECFNIQSNNLEEIIRILLSDRMKNGYLDAPPEFRGFINRETRCKNE